MEVDELFWCLLGEGERMRGIDEGLRGREGGLEAGEQSVKGGLKGG